MTCVITVVSPEATEKLDLIHRELSVPLSLTFHGRGTADRSVLELLGIDSNEKRIVMSVMNTGKSAVLMSELRRRLYIGIPGHGVAVSEPLKSMGGERVVSVMSEGEVSAGRVPDINRTYELIVAIANEGRTDDVMNAARAAGATGGTVLHGKGTLAEEAARFLNISIASEKEIILIVARREEKGDIMRSVLERAGTATDAGAILFSLPVTSVAGFGMLDYGEVQNS